MQVCQSLLAPAVVTGRVHVQQTAPVENRHAGRFGLVPGEDGAQSAFAIAREDFAEQRAANERRMPALAAKGWVYDARVRRGRRVQHLADRPGAHQRHVHGQKQETVHRGRQGCHASLHAREHARGEIAVMDGRYPKVRQLRRHQVRVVARHHMNVPQPRLAQARHHMAQHGLPAEGQQRLERPHARRKAGSQHNRGYGFRRIAGGAERHVLVLLPGGWRFLRDVHLVLGEDLLGPLPAVENDARAALLLEGRVEIDDLLAIDAAVFSGHFALEPGRELFNHDVETRMARLIYVRAAAIKPKHAAPARERTAIEALAHAKRQAGHGADEIGIVARLLLKRQFHEDVAARIAFEKQLGDAEGIHRTWLSSNRRFSARLEREHQVIAGLGLGRGSCVEPAGAAPKRVQRAKLEDELRRPGFQHFRPVLEPEDVEPGGHGGVKERGLRLHPPRVAGSFGAGVDVADREPPPAPQHPEPFGQRLLLIAHRRQAALGENAIEASARKRQVGTIRGNEFRPIPGRAGVREDQQIGADGRNAALVHQLNGRAQAAPDIGHRIACAEARPIEEGSG